MNVITLLCLCTPAGGWELDFELVREMTDYRTTPPAKYRTVLRHEIIPAEDAERYLLTYGGVTISLYRQGQNYTGGRIESGKESGKRISQSDYLYALGSFKLEPSRRFRTSPSTTVRKKILNTPCVREERKDIARKSDLQVVSWIPEDDSLFAKYGRLARFDYADVDGQLKLVAATTAISIKRGN